MSIRGEKIGGVHRRIILASLTSAAVAIALASCSLFAAPAPAPRTPASTPPTPTPTATPTTAPDVLFTITADLHSPEGSTVRVTETVHAVDPVPDDAKATWTAAGCEAAYFDLDPSTVVRIDARSELTGGPAPDSEYLLALFAGPSTSTGATGFTGDWRVAQAYCADGYLSMPGTATGWTGFDTSDGWVQGTWGASASTGAGDATRTMTATRCTIDRGPAAAGLELPAGWSTPDTRFGCFFGAPA